MDSMIPKYPEKVLTTADYNRVFKENKQLKKKLNPLKMDLTISKLTSYDSDDLLWYTKIGKKDAEMSLICIAAGKTLTESRSNAEKIASLLGNVKEPL